MPQFNTPGTLQVTYPSGSFGSTQFSYGNLTLLDSTPAASQIEVRYEPLTYMYTSTGPGININSESGGLSSAQLEAFQNLSGPRVVFVGEGSKIVFNETDETVEVPLPNYVEVEPFVYNTQTYTKLYYGNSSSGTPIPPAVSTSEPLVLRRSTNVTQATTTFQPGSRLTSEMLNNARNQNLYAIQELTEFGALAGEGGTGGGGEFDGNLWDISGAEQLKDVADGNVIWSGDNLYSTTDSQGIMPYTTDITASGYVLLSDVLATNATKTTWTPLNGDVVDIQGMTLSNVIDALNAKAAYFEDTSEGLVVNGGTEGMVEVESTDILLDGLVTIEGNLVAPLINGAPPLNEGSVLSDLGDVTAPTPSEGEFLVYDSSSSQWVNRTPAINGVTPPSVFIQNVSAENVNGALNPSPQPFPFLYLWNDSNYPDLQWGGDPSMTDGINVGSGGKGWISPFKGRIEVLGQAVWNTAIAASERTNVWFQITKTSADGSTTAVINGTNYSTPTSVNVNNNIPVASTAVIDVEIGDSIMYRMGRGNIGSGAAVTRYHAATITRLDFDATLYASEVIESDIVNTPTGALAVEQRVGVTDEGKPVYCQTRRWNGAFVPGADTSIFPGFFNGKTLVRVDGHQLYSDVENYTYYDESSFSLFGFYVSKGTGAEANDLRVYRSNNAPQPNLVFNVNANGYYNFYYTKDSDAAQSTMTVVPTGTLKELEDVYYIENSVQDQLQPATQNEATRTYSNSSYFSNSTDPSVILTYGTAQKSDWSQSSGIWTCPADGLYEVYVQFGLNLGTETQAFSYVQANTGSGFTKLGTNFHMRGLDPGGGNATQRLYMSSYQVVREFQQGTQIRIMFENQHSSNSSSTMDIENAKAKIRKIGPYTS